MYSERLLPFVKELKNVDLVTQDHYYSKIKFMVMLKEILIAPP